MSIRAIIKAMRAPNIGYLWCRYTHFRMDVGSVFKVELCPGDDAWRASFHITHWWFGSYYWHCWFLPEWLKK